VSRPEVVTAIYRPRPGKEQALRAVLRRHVPTLRAEGLATPRPVVLLRSRKDGTYLEVFEWATADAAGEAHANPRVGEVWKAIGEAAEALTLADLAEATERFPHFEPVNDLES
jgi:hypothetical protein